MDIEEIPAELVSTLSHDIYYNTVLFLSFSFS